MISEKKIKKFWLNSFQPFAHGNWTNGQIKIGNEEALKGRNKLILDQFEKIIKEKFSIDQIKKMRILDIGSYDGQTSYEIEKRIPFKEIISVEPRKKNFYKGKFVRNYLNIKSNVKFINTTLEDLNEKFDIIFCVGILHHLENINIFLKKLCNICGRSIFIDCLSYDTKNNFLNILLNNLNKKIIEPKDIIYKFRKKTVGISGHKLETNYYDGSTLDSLSVVTIPDNEYIKQIMYVNGFKSEILVTGKNYYRFIQSNFRDLSSTIIYAEKDNNYNQKNLVKEYVKTYEKNYLINSLNDKILSIVEKYNFLTKFFYLIENKNKFTSEILLNLKYNFEDKINFEKSKNCLRKKQFFKATRILYKIISKYNADYRTCYRSFALLAMIYQKKEARKKLFLDLLKNCNEHFPLEIVEELKKTYK